MPARGGLEAFRVGIAHVVRPHRHPGQAGVGLAGQQAGDFGLRGGVEVALGQFGNHAVAQRGPGAGRARHGEGDEGGGQQNGEFLGDGRAHGGRGGE